MKLDYYRLVEMNYLRDIFTIVILSLCWLGELLASNGVRELININGGWKYMKGDFLGADSLNYDDSCWEHVGIPHSFSMPYFMSRDFYVGYGWYRKSFYLKRSYVNKKVFIEFEGVFQEAEIFVNGKLAGTHEGGYTGFSIDISNYICKGKNLLAVRVNNNWKPYIAPRAGEHVFSGGIYRNVSLVIKNKSYIEWDGNFIYASGLSESNGEYAIVNSQTEICNTTGNSSSYMLKVEVVDHNGNVMAEGTNSFNVDEGSKETVHVETSRFDNPKLWSPASPYLYTVVSKLYRNNKVIDVDKKEFGFRWVEWTADKGFFLNGKHFYLRGANVHQDHAGWGDAVTEAGMLRDVRLMKEAGFNFIRGSHYPHSPAFVKACDRLGILFWSENAFWGIGGFKGDGYWNSGAYPANSKDWDAFDSSVKKQLVEMIRIHRNNPSIIAWSLSNEAFFTDKTTLPRVKKLLRECYEISRNIDPTRKVAVGGAQRPLGKDRIDNLADIAGYNGDGCAIADFQNPGFPTLVSEYGSVTSDRPGKYSACWGMLAKDASYKGLPWRSGQAIWCGFDHGSIAGEALGKMGIIDYFRIPKRAWYWYRNEYMNIPPPEWPELGSPAKLEIIADKTKNIKTDGTDDVMLVVTVLDSLGKELSNSPDVTLRVVAGPGEFPTGRSITFMKNSDIRIADGKAAIELRSYEAGVSVIEASSPGLTSARIEIEFVGDVEYNESNEEFRKERPYKRYVRQASDNILVFGRNNPTFSSSNKDVFVSGLGADGDNNTFWQPADEDKYPWWISDTEKLLDIKEVKVVFNRNYKYKYYLEVSDNMEDWKIISDKSDNDIEELGYLFKVSKPVKARFVRIRFTEYNPFINVAEFEIRGIVN